MNLDDNKSVKDNDNEKDKTKAADSSLLVILLLLVLGCISLGILNKNHEAVMESISIDMASPVEEEKKMTYEEFIASWADFDSDLSSVKPGDVVCFGRYDEDGDESNYLEVLKWDVLAVSDNSVLLISHNVIDKKPFNEESEPANWKTCTLRKWLNEDFIETAFNDNEKARLLTVSVNTIDSYSFYEPIYEEYPLRVGTVGCETTSDQVFILSYDEVSEYFAPELSMENAGYYSNKLVADAFSKLSRNQARESTWWLRSPAETMLVNLVVYHDYIRSSGRPVDDNDVGIRPVMWVSY